MARIKQPVQPVSKLEAVRGFDYRGLILRLTLHQSKNFYFIGGISTLIIVFGIFMVLSSSSVDSLTSHNNPYYVFLKQLLFAVIGTAGLVVFSILPLNRMMQLGQAVFAFGILAQLLVFSPMGISVGGNRNWLNLGFFSMQPSEFLKLGLIMLLSERLAKQQVRMFDTKEFLYVSWLKIVLPVAALVIFGNDLGTTIVIVLIAFGITWFSGIPAIKLRGLLTVAGVAVAILVMSGGSRTARITAWMFPGNDESSSFSWQSQHGIWALSAGHIFGVGVGNSKLKWSWIPEVDNDYIFAIIGEETGLIGATATILLFLALVFMMRRTYLRATNSYMQMATGGIIVWIGAQSLINVSVVVQNLPVLGVPLPLISSGGSSLIASMFAIGVLLGFERHIHQEELAAGASPAARARNRRMAAR